jgi:uncharacterized repeat protein (TIGR01451 family)
VTDDQGLTPVYVGGDLDNDSLLDPNETWLFTATAIVTNGPYVNLGTVTGVGVDANNTAVSDTDPSHHLGANVPSIQIVKTTNGIDTQTPTELILPAGSVADFTYAVTNSGNVPLVNIQVSDDQNVVPVYASGDGNVNGVLDLNETWVFSASAIVVPGPYVNVGTATGIFDGILVSSSEPSYHFGRLDQPAIDIEKSTNGVDADSPSGPTLPVGSLATYSYTIVNLGNVPLNSVTVTDDQGLTPIYNSGDANNDGRLDLNEAWLFTATSLVVAGQYRNVGTVTAVTDNGLLVDDQDASHHFGRFDTPAIDIEKLTNDQDTKAPTDLILTVGSQVAFTYLVANAGGVPLTNVTVTDDRGVVPVYQTGDTNGDTILDVNETWIFTATGSVIPGPYVNTGTAVAVGNGVTVADQDLSYHFGRLDTPAIDIEKFTNGQDVGSPLDLVLPVGSVVTFSYVVTNTGSVPLSDITVTDNRGVTPTYQGGDTDNDAVLGLDETWIYTAVSTVIAGPYDNTGTATGTGGGVDVMDEDLSYHYGGSLVAQIDIEKYIRPFEPGTPVEGRMTGGGSGFTEDQTRVTHGFELHCNTNIGPNNLQVNFDGNRFHLESLITATCLDTEIDQSPGPYKNAPFDTYIGSGSGRLNGVAGYLVDFTFTDAGEPGKNDRIELTIRDANGQVIATLSDSLDRGNHQTHRENKRAEDGVTGGVVIDSADLGDDADTPNGPIFPVGTRVDYTYVVTNPGLISLANVTVIDDNGTPNDSSDDFAPQPMLQAGFNIGDVDQDSLLDAGEKWLFEATRVVTPGLYGNLGHVTGAPVDEHGQLTGDAPAVDSDPNYHFGAMASVRIEKAVNAVDPLAPTPQEDADAQPGRLLNIGTPLIWTYRVSNVGTEPLEIESLIDDAGTPNQPADDFAPVLLDGDTNANGLLDANEVWIYTSLGVANQQVSAGNYANIATVSAVGTLLQNVVVDTDAAHHYGAAPTVRLEKAMNAMDPLHPTTLEDADGFPAPQLVTGTSVVWTYQVWNDGNTSLVFHSLTDDSGTPGITSDDFVPAAVLDDSGSNLGDVNHDGMINPGEAWQFTSAGITSYTVQDGPYVNLAEVIAEDFFTKVEVADEDLNRHTGQTRGEGKTPGFWFNNARNRDALAWPRGTAGELIYDPSQLFGSVFSVPASAALNSLTLHDALGLGGGGSSALARAAVAGLLGATHPVVAYPLTAREVVDRVDAALASGNPTMIESLKNLLDGYNNLDADLDQWGNSGNTAPIAVHDTLSTTVGMPVTIAVLANDSDANGDSLAVTLVTPSSAGTVVINADQTLTFTPSSTFTGSTSFTYRANDGSSESNLATVFVQVNSATMTDTFTSGHAAKSIPDNRSAGTTGTLIAPQGIVRDLNVRVNIDHTRASDMDVFLLGPTGIRVELFTDVGGNGDHFRNTVLDSDATSSITGASAPFTGTFRPEGNLSSFNGSNLGGTWTLQVIDDQNREVGQLLNWSISVVYEPTTPPPAVAATAPWTEPFAQNASDPRDVNNDGIVSPIDALLTINALNERTGIAGQATSTRNATSNLFLDVSGDGMLSPIDTLLVINWLNEASQTSAEVVSDETPDAADTVFAAQAIAADASVSSQRLVAMRGLEIRGLDEAGITDEPLATVPSRTIVDWLKEDSLFPMLGDADEWDKVSENDRDWELMIDEVVDDVSQQW